YRVKKADITDVVDAQSAYAEARLAYSQTIIDYRTARFRLEQNLGR
ncbi:MAG: TolC family protein, partial [Acidobacteria bacterium]|nr:TolC family protein [Acidobacteriota bacterium]